MKIGGIVSLVFSLMVHKAIAEGLMTNFDLPFGSRSRRSSSDLDILIDNWFKPVQSITEINKNLSFVLEGDIVRPHGRNTIFYDTGSLWPNGKLPFIYGETVTLTAINAFEEARTEIAMRSCINVKPRNREKDYVSIQSMNGCWSRIGKAGNYQNLSLGNGCQYRSIAIHEILHALGFLHEQSRGDRDNYITVLLDNIRKGKKSNFKKYFGTNNLREEYDFHSLMHYNDDAFSKDDVSKTILTKNPNFQSFISYRKDVLSNSDVVKLNRLYRCSDTLLYSYHCNFDEQTICGWVNAGGGWTWGDMKNPPGYPFPSVDGTHGVANKGGYMFADINNNSTVMISMNLKSKVEKQCLRFWFYINENNYSPVLSVFLAQIDPETYDVNKTIPLGISLTKHTAGSWLFFRKTFSAPADYKLIIRAETDGNSGIAIDDFGVVDKECDTAYFTITKFSSKKNIQSNAQPLPSPKFYTEDGYAFVLLVHPNRTSNEQTKLGVFYSLVSGNFDDNVSWPIKNRVVRLTIMDQTSGPFDGQHVHSAFLDTVRNRFSQVDFQGSDMITIKELEQRGNFLKHDNLIISVSVKDMTRFASRSDAEMSTASQPSRVSPTAPDKVITTGIPEGSKPSDITSATRRGIVGGLEPKQCAWGTRTIIASVVSIALLIIVLILLVIVIKKAFDLHKKMEKIHLHSLACVNNAVSWPSLEAQSASRETFGNIYFSPELEASPVTRGRTSRVLSSVMENQKANSRKFSTFSTTKNIMDFQKAHQKSSPV